MLLSASVHGVSVVQACALVVRAFFDSRFAREDDVREVAQDFLAETLPAELSEVRYSAAD